MKFEDLSVKELQFKSFEEGAGGFKVLMISTDRDFFSEDGEVRQRNIEYGRLVKELHLIVFNERDVFFVETDLRKNYVNISENVFVYPTNSKNRWFYVFDAIKICKKIIKERWGGKLNGALVATQDPFECGLVGQRIKKKFKIPWQAQIHTDFFSPHFRGWSLLNWVRFIIAQFIIPDADCFRVVSKRIKDSLVVRFNIPKDRVINLPIFVDVFKTQYTAPAFNLREKYSQFDFICLMASRLTKEKNISMAIKAFKNVVKKYPRSGLIIAGNGPLEKKLKSQSSKIKDNVIFEPWTGDLISYYKGADLFLLTSNYEGYGRTVVEAMAAGCPVIMTGVGLAGDLLKHELNGLAVPVGDSKKLEEAILKMIENPDLAEKFVANSSDILKSLSDKEDYLQKYKQSWEMCFSRFSAL